MKLEEAKLLFEERVDELPPAFRKEFTVDNVKRMRDIAKKYGIILNMGSGSSIKRNKVYVGYSYHFFGLHKKGSGGAYGSYDKPSAAQEKSFWTDFIREFSKSYNISAPMDIGAPDQPITTVQQAMNAVHLSKIRFVHKHVVEDKDAHARKVEAHLNYLLSAAIHHHVYHKLKPHLLSNSFEYDSDDEMKKIKEILKTEKANGYTYPEFEKKLNVKTWPEEFRKIRLASHVKAFKEVDSYKSPETKDEVLRKLIKNLEYDEKNHEFSHPEMDKYFPKDKRSIIYWQKVIGKKNPSQDDVTKHILKVLKKLATETDSYYKKSNIENIKYKISMARKAGMDNPEFTEIEKYIKANKKLLTTDDYL